MIIASALPKASFLQVPISSFLLKATLLNSFLPLGFAATAVGNDFLQVVSTAMILAIFFLAGDFRQAVCLLFSFTPYSTILKIPGFGISLYSFVLMIVCSYVLLDSEKRYKKNSLIFCCLFIAIGCLKFSTDLWLSTFQVFAFIFLFIGLMASDRRIDSFRPTTCLVLSMVSSSVVIAVLPEASVLVLDIANSGVGYYSLQIDRFPGIAGNAAVFGRSAGLVLILCIAEYKTTKATWRKSIVLSLGLILFYYGLATISKQFMLIATVVVLLVIFESFRAAFVMTTLLALGLVFINREILISYAIRLSSLDLVFLTTGRETILQHYLAFLQNSPEILLSGIGIKDLTAISRAAEYPISPENMVIELIIYLGFFGAIGFIAIFLPFFSGYKIGKWTRIVLIAFIVTANLVPGVFSALNLIILLGISIQARQFKVPIRSFNDGGV